MEASMEYPKSLYLKGWEDLSATVIVCDEKEEAEARKQGYKMLNEPEGTKPVRRKRVEQ
jgi:hypothetical protein